MTRGYSGGHPAGMNRAQRRALPGAVGLDPDSIQARAMLGEIRRRDCDTCGVTHVEVLCRECSRSERRPVYHLADGSD
jgi:hypothetical protein